MVKKRPFRILSIDGGGILGLYSTEILRLIQERFFPEHSFSDQFDLIAGTSTGGIIALGLGLGRNPNIISEFYESYGSKIFPHNNKLSKFLLFLRSIVGTRYSNEVLIRFTREFFGDSTMDDAKTCLCIPSIDVVNSRGVVFKTPHGVDLYRDKYTKMWEVALATSSAPTYFPVFSTEEWPGLVDGGLWQNNPALIAALEAHRYFINDESKYSNLHILSIGNPLTHVTKNISLKSKNSSLLNWNSKLIELPMKVNSQAVEDILTFMNDFGRLGIERYVRIASSDVGDATRFLSMDNASQESMSWMVQRARHDFNNFERKLRDFFNLPLKCDN